DRLAWATPLAGSCTRRHDGEDSKKRGQIACKSIAEEGREPYDARLSGRHDRLGRVERAWPPPGRDHEPKLGGKADPDPLPPIRAAGHAFASRVRLPRMLAFNKVPHLVELHLGHRQIAQQMAVDRLSLKGRPSEPGQHGLFRHAAYKPNACQINPDQE